ncbi:MAG: hypothetical protein KIT59_05245 [Nitrosomonas sp.]|nr:hypothetical protein [Nitrosomonas sp.]
MASLQLLGIERLSRVIAPRPALEKPNTPSRPAESKSNVSDYGLRVVRVMHDFLPKRSGGSTCSGFARPEMLKNELHRQSLSCIVVYLDYVFQRLVKGF